MDNKLVRVDFAGERVVEQRLSTADEIKLLQEDPGNDGMSTYYPKLTKDEALTMLRFYQNMNGGDYNQTELLRYEELQRKAAGQI